MSFVDARKSNHRAATVVAVTIIEAAVLFAVVRGLAVTFTRPEALPNPIATDIPLPKPSPQPTIKPRQRDHVSPAVNPADPRPVPYATATADPQPLFTPAPLATGTVVIEPGPLATPTHAPSFIPRSPLPRNKPGTWATANDYPARDLREGNQGVTHFRLSIGADGRVLSCAIITSSGFPGLDLATCAKVAARAQFDPATDAAGARVASTYANKIRWEIPE